MGSLSLYLPKPDFLGIRTEGLDLPPAKPSATHAVMNSNNPKIQQNTPTVQVRARYVPDNGCVRRQTLKAHVPAESIKPKRLMEAAAYRKFEAVLRHKLEGFVRAESWASIAVSRGNSTSCPFTRNRRTIDFAKP
jgi:hypothetical protein